MLRASNGLPQSLIGKAAYAPREGLTGWVGYHGRPLNLDNRRPKWLANVQKILDAKDLTWKSKYKEGGASQDQSSLPWLGVPILMDGQSKGVIRISERDKPGQFSRADEGALELVARHLGASLADLRDRERLHELRGQLRASRDIVTKVIGESGLRGFHRLEGSLREALQLAADGLQAQSVGLFQLEGERVAENPFWYLRENISGAPPTPDSGTLDAICRKYWSYLGMDLPNQASPWMRFLASSGTRSSVGALLKVGPRPVGILLLNFRSPRSVGEDQHAIEEYATNLALCLEVVHLAREFHKSGAREYATLVARDIHDSALHILGSHVVKWLGTAKDLVRAERYGECIAALTIAEDTVGFAAKEMRFIMNALNRHPVHDRGLVVALRDLAGILNTKNARIECRLPQDDGNLPIGVKLHLFRIAGAALENAIEHAEAQLIRLTLEVSQEEAILSVTDDGCGFIVTEEPNDRQYGLKSIRDRVEWLGGKREIISSPNNGTSVEVRVPIGESDGKQSSSAEKSVAAKAN